MAAAKYKLELKAGVNGAQFQSSSGKHIELDKDHPTFETTDANEFAALRELPFLKVASEKDAG